MEFLKLLVRHLVSVVHWNEIVSKYTSNTSIDKMFTVVHKYIHIRTLNL